MNVLWLILQFLIKCAIITSTSFVDDNFKNDNNLTLNSDSDFQTMHDIKCTYNTNKPFNQYLKNSYATSEESFKYCNIEELRINFSKYENNPNRYVRDRYKTYPKMAATFIFLRDSKFLTDKIPFLNGLLNKYYSEFDRIIDDVDTSRNAHKTLLDDNKNMLDKFNEAKEAIGNIEYHEEYIKELFDSLDRAISTCNGNAVRDINVYKNIVSTFSIKDELDGSLNGINDEVKKLNEICAFLSKIPQIDPKIPKSVEKYREIVLALGNTKSNLKRYEANLKENQAAIISFIEQNDIKTIQKYNNLLRNLKSSIELFDSSYQNAEKILNDVKALIDKVSLQLTQSPSHTKTLLQNTIPSLQGHVNQIVTIKRNRDNWETSLDRYDSFILTLSSNNDRVLSEASREKEFIELSIHVVNGIEEVMNDDFSYDSNANTMLKNYLNTHRNIESYVDPSIIDNFQRDYSDFKEGQNQLTSQVDNNIQELSRIITIVDREKEKLINQYSLLLENKSPTKNSSDKGQNSFARPTPLISPPKAIDLKTAADITRNPNLRVKSVPSIQIGIMDNQQNVPTVEITRLQPESMSTQLNEGDDDSQSKDKMNSLDDIFLFPTENENKKDLITNEYSGKSPIESNTEKNISEKIEENSAKDVIKKNEPSNNFLDHPKTIILNDQEKIHSFSTVQDGNQPTESAGNVGSKSTIFMVVSAVSLIIIISLIIGGVLYNKRAKKFYAHTNSPHDIYIGF